MFYFNYLICYWNELLKHLRAWGLLRSSKFAEIRKYKKKHMGQRCFIVCTGPSLTYEDLELLKGEITFSMNGIVKGFHKTDWRPTYYGIHDHFVYAELQDIILENSTLIPFIADWIVEVDWIVKRIHKISPGRIPSNAIQFPFSTYNHRVFSKDKYSTKFSGNAAAIVYDGYTVTYSLLQIAVYMGFKEIYLLGCDCYYSPDPKKRHFVETQHVDPSATTAAGRMKYAYRVAKRYADKHHIHIYNATRGGHLDVFERVSLEEILSPKPIPMSKNERL
jgi:hypothetical protein